MPYGEKFEEALLYATRLHQDQTRKGTDTPYITHLLAVAAIVGENGGTEDEVVAALLHDAPEDQGGEERLEDIRIRFGEAVAEIVAGCTDTYEGPKPAWRPRKEAYIARMVSAPAPVQLVSSADKLHNARSILADLRAVGDDLWDRFTGVRRVRSGTTAPSSKLMRQPAQTPWSRSWTGWCRISRTLRDVKRRNADGRDPGKWLGNEERRSFLSDGERISGLVLPCLSVLVSASPTMFTIGYFLYELLSGSERYVRVPWLIFPEEAEASESVFAS